MMSFVSDSLAILGKIRDMSVTKEVNELLIEAQNKILKEQASHNETIAKCRALEAEVALHNQWNHEISRYKMVQIFGGRSNVFALKKGSACGEPPHWICPNCKSNKAISILQYHQRGRKYDCPACNFSMLEYGNQKPEYVED